MPPPSYIMEIPTHGPRTSNVVEMGAVADSAAFAAWAKAFRWEPAKDRAGYEGT